MRARGLGLVGLIGLVGALGACGGGDDTATVATRPSAPVPATTATTTPATSPAPTTTSTAPLSPSPTASATGAVAAPTATAPPTTTTTAAPTTTVPPVRGWQPVEFAPGATPVGYSGNWSGAPSPPAPVVEGATPADGYYAASLVAPWDPASPGVLHAEVRRFGYCRDLPAGTCSPNPDDPDELGVDPTWSRPVVVALDATTRVVVEGFACAPEVKLGSGADLAELFAAFDAAYGDLIAPQVLAGVQDNEIAAALGNEPVQGFVADQVLCPGQLAGVLHFQHGAAPSLLLQVLLRYVADGPPELLRPSDVVVLNGVQVTGGVPTYYFSAGFAS